jgi:hypothetical protein
LHNKYKEKPFPERQDAVSKKRFVLMGCLHSALHQTFLLFDSRALFI